VLDAESRAPIWGADIHLVGAGEHRVTDARGRFTFGDRDIVGPDTVAIRHIQYDSMRLAIGTRDLGPLDLELHLTPRPIPLAGLEVAVARRARTEARRMADLYQGRLWPREEFESFVLAAESAVDPLRWAPGVYQVYEGPDGERCVVVRVGSGCAATYVNQMQVPTNHLVTLVTDIIDSYVILDPIQATFLYGPDGSAGAVLIFTRR
jgi:hypothetical protein